MDIEKLKLLIDLIKFILGSVVVALVTFWINAGFKDREIALSEHQYLVQFKDDALNEDIEVRRRLAEYFAKLTLGKEMRERWLAYLELIEQKRVAQLENKARIAELGRKLLNEETPDETQRIHAQLEQALANSSRLAAELGRIEEVANLVDCLLPGQIRMLGKSRFLAPRRAIRTTAADCEIRGGEFVVDSDAHPESALAIWLPSAEAGDSEAQTRVGEIFEQGIDGNPDYTRAAEWYRKAAEQGNSKAQFYLGTLYEKGLGVPQNFDLAMEWYQKSRGKMRGDETSANEEPE